MECDLCGHSLENNQHGFDQNDLHPSGKHGGYCTYCKECNPWIVLHKNFVDDRGIIRKRDKNYQPTREEFDTIDYLCDEWDYGWEG